MSNEINESNTETKDETKSEKFVRIATSRVNKILKSFTSLENLANSNVYAYTQEQIDVMFNQLQTTLDETRKAFEPKKTTERTFSFGDVPPAPDDDIDNDNDDITEE